MYVICAMSVCGRGYCGIYMYAFCVSVAGVCAPSLFF